jgi:hypothetical protein
LFADQKYLDELPTRFDGVAVVTHRGLNLAPWNAAASTPLEVVYGRVIADGDPLIFFHFHGLSKLATRVYDPGWSPRGDTRVLRAAVYRPYIRELAETEAVAKKILRRPPARPAPWGGTRPRPWWWRAGRSGLEVVRGVVSRRFMIAPRGGPA